MSGEFGSNEEICIKEEDDVTNNIAEIDQDFEIKEEILDDLQLEVQFQAQQSTQQQQPSSLASLRHRQPSLNIQQSVNQQLFQHQLPIQLKQIQQTQKDNEIVGSSRMAALLVPGQVSQGSGGQLHFIPSSDILDFLSVAIGSQCTSATVTPGAAGPGQRFQTFNESLNASSSNAGNSIYVVTSPLHCLNTIPTVSTPINRRIAIRPHLATSTPTSVQPIVSASTSATTLVTSVKNVTSADESIRFICQECNRSFKCKRALKEHKKTYHKDICIQILTNIENVNKFRCKYCNKDFRDENRLQNHILKFHPKNVVSETKAIHYVKKDIKHESQDSMTLEFICKICEKTFVKERYVKAHIKIHTNNIIHKCEICNIDYKSKVALHRHIEKTHAIGQDMYNGTNDQVISNVSGSFITKINKDQITVKKIDKEHVCPICPKTFTNRNKLNIHKMNDHTKKSKKIMKCPVSGCSKDFKNLSEMRLHLKSSNVNGGHSLKLDREEKSFNNFKEFEVWKEATERRDSARYITRYSTIIRKNGSRKHTYYCNRSGKLSFANHWTKGKRKRLQKSKGSVKLGYYCPATIECIARSDGVVSIVYNRSHYGHQTNSASSLLKQRIHESDKQFIIDKYCDGVTKSRILQDVQKRGGRSSLISPKDIRNILRDVVRK